MYDLIFEHLLCFIINSFSISPQSNDSSERHKIDENGGKSTLAVHGTLDDIYSTFICKVFLRNGLNCSRKLSLNFEGLYHVKLLLLIFHDCVFSLLNNVHCEKLEFDFLSPQILLN